MTEERPHTLTLALTGDDYDPEMPLYWDEATLRCSHSPDAGPMPCAVLEPCGCPYRPEEITNEEWEYGHGPCDASPTGQHTYLEGIPSRPGRECWAVHHADNLLDAAMALGVGPGTYEVWPRCVAGGLLELFLTHPDDAATAAPDTQETR